MTKPQISLKLTVKAPEALMERQKIHSSFVRHHTHAVVVYTFKLMRRPHYWVSRKPLFYSLLATKGSGE